mmetsp:Transcript_27211/g.26083  ORF Transcript_27211/g.26083 Transcript_27211/m.26083 type:complete len:88 (+) Transcript_27211:1289-1552(+)
MLQNTFTFCGQCTDSGDGSTLFALAKLIQENNLKRTISLLVHALCITYKLRYGIIQKARRASPYKVVAGRYMRFQFQGINSCLVEDL